MLKQRYIEQGTRFLTMFLFTRPDYDPVTKYLSAWSKILIEEASAKAIEVIDLVGVKANKKESAVSCCFKRTRERQLCNGTR